MNIKISEEMEEGVSRFCLWLHFFKEIDELSLRRLTKKEYDDLVDEFVEFDFQALKILNEKDTQ